jgi:hypothetical protein
MRQEVVMFRLTEFSREYIISTVRAAMGRPGVAVAVCRARLDERVGSLARRR